jgi:LmeA-like phospholipid-binding
MRPRAIAAIALAAVLLLLVLAQLFLPGIAADNLRHRIARSGSGVSVEVDAFPAIELLWHQADKVVVRVAHYHSSTGHLSSLLDEAADVGTLDATADVVQAGLLTLRNATLSKRGSTLRASATVTESDLRASIPVLQSVQPIASGGGRLMLRGTATLFGVSATVDATVAAVGGAVLLQPDVPFGSLATISVFSDPHVQVQGVSATTVPGGFQVSGVAQLH